MKKELFDDAIELLKQLIRTPSFSKEEENTALLLQSFLKKNGVAFERLGNNIYAKNKEYSITKSSLLLNSHHDTVRPNQGYKNNPFEAIEEDGKLFGLGSNDAGGCLVSLLAAFLHFYSQTDLKYNIVFAATAEEEISGTGGIEMLLPHLGNINCAIVGEPTKMQMAVAERGLMVLDCVAPGKAGHAARSEGENAIYNALHDINWLHNHQFDKISSLLGETKATVTVIETENKQHNVIPSGCCFVIDVRCNELYSFEEILQVINMNFKSAVTPRSTRLKSTSISIDHPLVKAGLSIGKGYYGSPTTSDKALMPFPSLKMGPGDSARSHMADEFIFLDEIENGIADYIKIMEQILI